MSGEVGSSDLGHVYAKVASPQPDDGSINPCNCFMRLVDAARNDLRLPPGVYSETLYVPVLSRKPGELDLTIYGGSHIWLSEPAGNAQRLEAHVAVPVSILSIETSTASGS